MAEREKHDILVQDHGSIILVIPQHPDVKDWFRDHVPSFPKRAVLVYDGVAQTLGPAVAVEPRFIFTLLDGLEEAGFTLAEDIDLPKQRTLGLPRVGGLGTSKYD
jgi:hypothetical protein